jgi:hypothetical protein
MVPNFKMDDKTLLSFKTCKLNYFLKLFQDCLNLANCSSFTTNFVFPKNSKWPKNSIWQIFCKKNSWYFVSETAEWNILIFGYVIRLMLFYCKKFVASTEKSNWRLFSRWRRKCLYLSPNIFKNDIFICFSFFYSLDKNKTFFMQNLFSWKFKMAEWFNKKDDIFQKISRFHCWMKCSHFLLCCGSKDIFKNKNIVAKLKNQNGGLIQYGVEHIFYCSHNKPPF